MDIFRVCMQLAELGVKYAQYKTYEIEHSDGEYKREHMGVTEHNSTLVQSDNMQNVGEQHEVTRGASCLPCGRHHTVTASAALGEALRFARSDGMQNPEVIKRLNIAEEELDIMERIDFAPSSIAKLPDSEKPVAHWVVKSARDIRHDLDEIKTVDDLENAAGKAQDWAAEYKARMQGVPAEMINKVKEALSKVRSGEWTKEEALNRLKGKVSQESNEVTASVPSGGA